MSELQDILNAAQIVFNKELTEVTHFFYDGDYRFKLRYEELTELESILDMGILLIERKLIQGDLKIEQWKHILRLGLIGSEQMSREKAFRFINEYIKPGYVKDQYGIAINVFSTSVNGTVERFPDEEEEESDIEVLSEEELKKKD